MTSTRVLQFNDCAYVARSSVRAAQRVGINWDYLGPDQVRPMTAAPKNPLLAKARFIPYVMRRMVHLSRADLVHVHYGTSTRLIRESLMPVRPYVLTLHGTDIRQQWKDPGYHDEIQAAIDGAKHVFYANTDNQEDATKARADAEFLPSLIDVQSLPTWRPEGPQRIMFISRWDDDKGVSRQLDLVSALKSAVGDRAELLGIEWGPGARAARDLGVTLLPRMKQNDYYAHLAKSAIGVGQASNYFSTSEFEAMAMGLPVAALGSRLPRPDTGGVPPVMEGGVDEVVEQVLIALDDPQRAVEALGSKKWAIDGYSADNYVQKLEDTYSKAY